jgi:hypothetical protein
MAYEAKNDVDSDDLKLTKAEKDALLKTARERYTRAMDRERENIRLAYEDLDFEAGNQWPADVAKTRNDESRPVLTINQMPQFVHQVTGDIRKMRPAIKVVGVDDQADPKLADLREGMTRYIENRSDASGIYFQAADSQVACGIGHARVTTEYADDTTFEQEIRIEGVDDGVSVLWDPDAKRLTREDAGWCFVPVDHTHSYFKEHWPDASMEEFEDIKTWSYYSDWKTNDTIRVAEYWVKKPKTLTLALTQTGETINCSEDDDFEGGLTAKQKLALCEANNARIEKRESYTICRYLITVGDVLESSEWMGRFIPIVPFVGEEVRIGRNVVRRGIIREAKDAQRQFNYFCSAHTEVVALQPKAPWLVTEVNVGKYQGMWEQANTKNFPYLLWSPDAKNGNREPSRVAPAVSSAGIDEGLNLANENMRRVIGIYDASLGARSNETSGVAIKQREQQGDTGTILYLTNFSRAVRQIGKIVIDLIPHVYDTQRTIRIMGEDGKIDLMQINQEKDKAGMPILDQNGQPAMLNDMSIGAYDVIAEAGNSYATKREEASDSMLQFMQALPNTAPLVADLIAKAQEWPMADKFSERLHAALPPQIIAAEKAKEQEESGQPPQPDPQQQVAQQAQQAQMQLGMQKMQAETETETQKARKAKADADAAEADAETARVNTLLAKQKLGKGEIDTATGLDEHKQGMAHAQDKHLVHVATTADKHFMELARGEQAMMNGQEKHDATIDQMNQPAEA